MATWPAATSESMRTGRCLEYRISSELLQSCRFFLLFANHRSDCLEFIAFGQIDKFHALSITASFPDVLHESAHHLGAGGYDHDLVGLPNRQRAHHTASLVGGFHRDDALAASRLNSVFIEGRPFADAVFASHQQGGVGYNGGERDH